MDPVVSTDFRVERRGHHVAFSDGDDPTCCGPVIDLGKDLHSRSDLLDPGGADEDRVHLVGEVGEVEVTLERDDLPSEGVATNGDVQPAERLLVLGAVDDVVGEHDHPGARSEEHTSELQSLMRISYAVFCLKKKNNKHT